MLGKLPLQILSHLCEGSVSTVVSAVVPSYTDIHFKMQFQKSTRLVWHEWFWNLTAVWQGFWELARVGGLGASPSPKDFPRSASLMQWCWLLRRQCATPVYQKECERHKNYHESDIEDYSATAPLADNHRHSALLRQGSLAAICERCFGKCDGCIRFTPPWNQTTS